MKKEKNLQQVNRNRFETKSQYKKSRLIHNLLESVERVDEATKLKPSHQLTESEFRSIHFFATANDLFPPLLIKGAGLQGFLKSMSLETLRYRINEINTNIHNKFETIVEEALKGKKESIHCDTLKRYRFNTKYMTLVKQYGKKYYIEVD